MYRKTSSRSNTKVAAAVETALVVVLLGLAMGLLLNRSVQRHPAPELTSSASPFTITGTVTPAPPATGGSLRGVYGHSLVAGGIHSIDELTALIERDPQLAEHYKNFDLSKAHIIALDHDVVAYVSYRLAQGIYWQVRPTIIEKGEQVITDGTNFIRTRCGNQIAYAPAFPTSRGEPEDIDIVVADKFVEPPESVGPTTANLITPGAPPPVSVTPSLGDVPQGPVQPLPGESSPPIVPPCCIAGSGGVPSIPQTPSLNSPPSQFSADEFSNISLTILGHSCSLPSEEVALLAGIFLVVALRLAFWR